MMGFFLSLRSALMALLVFSLLVLEAIGGAGGFCLIGCTN